MSMLGWRIVQNTQILCRAEMIPRKHNFWSFLAIAIAVCQIQMILTVKSLQNEHDGMGICAKHTNFIQGGNHSWKTPFLVVFGYNNCSVTNHYDFKTHTSSYWAWCDGDMCKTHKFCSERKCFLENTIFGRFEYNNCSVSIPNDYSTHTSSKWAWWVGDMRKTQKFYSERK